MRPVLKRPYVTRHLLRRLADSLVNLLRKRPNNLPEGRRSLSYVVSILSDDKLGCRGELPVKGESGARRVLSFQRVIQQPGQPDAGLSKPPSDDRAGFLHIVIGELSR